MDSFFTILQCFRKPAVRALLKSADVKMLKVVGKFFVGPNSHSTFAWEVEKEEEFTLAFFLPLPDTLSLSLHTTSFLLIVKPSILVPPRDDGVAVAPTQGRRHKLETSPANDTRGRRGRRGGTVEFG